MQKEGKDTCGGYTAMYYLASNKPVNDSGEQNRIVKGPDWPAESYNDTRCNCTSHACKIVESASRVQGIDFVGRGGDSGIRDVLLGCMGATATGGHPSKSNLTLLDSAVTFGTCRLLRTMKSLNGTSASTGRETSLERDVSP